MLGDLRIEALTHRCAACDTELVSQHLVLAVYWHKQLRAFERQVELGLLGAGVRNVWSHFSCEKPLITSWVMNPDMHNCIRCKKILGKEDLVQPVFQITDNKAVNPLDPTDVGIALNERVYFTHCNCANPKLDKQSSNILVSI